MNGSLVEVLDMIFKLVLAVVLGGLIGYERESHGRPAGLRTHILVTLGATIFTIVGVSFTGIGMDPSRIAAQVVTGIGFLGAGTIIRQGSVVRGLTTAASLWTIAAIGVAIGVGGMLYYLAIVSTAVVFLTLGLINKMEHMLLPSLHPRDLVVSACDRAGMIIDLMQATQDAGVEVQSFIQDPTDEPGKRVYRFRFRFSNNVQPSAVAEKISAVDGVTGFTWG